MLARATVVASMAALLIPAQAGSQEAGEAAVGAATSRSAPTLEEIVVVAQKREENVQDVPVAVTAFTRADIDRYGLDTIQDLTVAHPSVSFDTAQSFQNSSLKIRGVGTVGNSRSFEGAVGVFVDGVYRPRSGMTLMDILDIDQIEILRGPQGTLFGKNTVAGTISLNSTLPDTDALGGDVEMSFGNHDLRQVSGAVNLPLGEAAAFRLAASYRERDGFFESPDNGDQFDTVDRYGFKAQLLFNPTDRLQVRIVGDRARSDAHCCWGAATSENGPTVPLIDVFATVNGLTFVPAPDAERDRAQSLNTLPGEVVEDEGLAGLVRWDVGGFTLTSITAYRDWSHNEIRADTDFVPADLLVLDEPAEIESISQELRLSTEKGNTDILFGLYFATEDYLSQRSVEGGGDADNYLNALVSAELGAVACLPPIVMLDCAFPVGIGALLPDGVFTFETYRQDSESAALFAHSSTRIGEHFNLVAGIRYTRETKDGGVDNAFWYDSAIVRAVLEAGGIPDDGTPRNGLDLIGTFYSPSFTAETEDTEPTGVLALQYFFTPELMLYGSFEHGYKAGGVNLFREGAITATTYQPEDADSVEVGLKARYWNGRARTNVAVFDTRFSDLQINYFTGLEFRTENTGSAETKGLEVENQLQLTEALRLDVSLTYLDSTFGRIENPFIAHLSGRDTPRAPEIAAVTSLVYDRPLSSGNGFLARGTASYMGSHFVGADVAVERKVDSYTIVDLEVGMRSAAGVWEGTVYCRNCTDEDYRTIYFNSVFQPGTYSSFLNAPREYGLRLRARF